jgi:F5/8 type C domain
VFPDSDNESGSSPPPAPRRRRRSRVERVVTVAILATITAVLLTQVGHKSTDSKTSAGDVVVPAPTRSSAPGVVQGGSGRPPSWPIPTLPHIKGQVASTPVKPSPGQAPKPGVTGAKTVPAKPASPYQPPATSAGQPVRNGTPPAKPSRRAVTRKTSARKTSARKAVIRPNVDWARGRPTATNVSLADYPGSRVTDGSTQTFWASAPDSVPASLTIDLGRQVSSLRTVVLGMPPAPSWRPANWAARTLTVTVLTSQNGSSWSTAVAAHTYSFGNGDGNSRRLSMSRRTARFVRVVITGYGKSTAAAAELSRVEVRQG